MAHVTGDRVKDTTTTTGTGNITVSGSAPTGFRTFSTVATTNGDTCWAAIVGGSEWEVCLLTRVSANEYSRATPLASSTGSAVSFAAGTKDVFITLPASRVADDTAYASSWDGDTIRPPSKNAVYDKFEGLIHPGYISANWYVPFNFGTQSAGVALGANTIVYVPFLLTRQVTISDLGCTITTLAAAGNLKLAIYANNATTNRPSGTPLAETGSITTGSTGNVSADITGSNVTLAPGMYWAAFWADNGTVVLLGLDRAQYSLSIALLGASTQANVVGASNRMNIQFTSAETYGTWPNATSETLTEVAATNQQYILQFKAA